MWDELPVAALDFSSLLVCVVFLPQGGGFVGIRIGRTIVPPIVHSLEALLNFVSVPPFTDVEFPDRARPLVVNQRATTDTKFSNGTWHQKMNNRRDDKASTHRKYNLSLCLQSLQKMNDRRDDGAIYPYAYKASTLGQKAHTHQNRTKIQCHNG